MLKNFIVICPIVPLPPIVLYKKTMENFLHLRSMDVYKVRELLDCGSNWKLSPHLAFPVASDVLNVFV
jgi:hypothetical protein